MSFEAASILKFKIGTSVAGAAISVSYMMDILSLYKLASATTIGGS